MNGLEEVVGFRSSDLEEIRGMAPSEVSVSFGPGSVGKGAEALGVTLLIDTLVVMGGINTLIQFGGYARRVIDWMRDKTGAQPTISDPTTLGAVAAASVEGSMRARLDGSSFLGTVPITASVGAGTDARDIYAAIFGGEDFAIVIFMSPTGMVLGTVAVPAQMGYEGGEWRERTPEEIAAWWPESSSD